MLVKVSNFDLKNTVEGGQIFNYYFEGGHYYIVHSGSIIKIRQNSPSQIEFYTFPNANGAALVKSLLNYGSDYMPVVKKYFSDKRILSSYRKYSGVKIVSLEPWECLLGFLCSQMNNIPRIRGMVLSLSRKFGKKAKFDGKTFYLFPTPKRLVRAPLADYESCKLGYRTKYIRHAAIAVNGGFKLNSLRTLPYSDAKRGLKMLFGIGEKVADCILLFSLGFTEAFPVDVWIKRIMENLYFKGKKTPEKKISEFAQMKFGKDAAIVHEFLFSNRKILGAQYPAYPVLRPKSE
ncbi:MAG: DNA glycosylase [Candidatus Micrarchaeota archaeon]